ncbi:MAG: right-handed parallel beta-helix repeat-containing protein [Oscillospiraceae bacterium]
MIINVLDFGICANTGADNTLPLRNLLSSIKSIDDVTIQFNEGIYHFYPDYANELLLYIPNHDEDSVKRIAFTLCEQHGISICGNNTSFVFGADIIPFYFYKCDNITVSGINIDYACPIYSEADIISADDKEITMAIDADKYPYSIINEQLYFPRGGELQPLIRWLEMDKERLAPVYDTHDVVFGDTLGGITPQYCEIKRGVISLTLSNKKQHFLASSRAGNKLILRHHLRTHPCFYAAYCTNVQLLSVNVYHASGMAFIAEHTCNIDLTEFNVKINPDNPRIFTATADATHFVYCSGTININSCLFENQLDDPINIHGIYAKINKVINPTSIIVQLVHFQHKGVSIGEVGQPIRIVDNETMLPCFETTISEIHKLNKDFTEIILNEPCDTLSINCVIENLAYIPDVNIRKCTFRNNRARGPLLTSAGKVVVEDNYFCVPGAAILIEGDSNNWFESGATKDITICNNVFDNCAYVSDWGNAPIQITPSTIKTDGSERFHKLLQITNNTFNCFDEALIYAKHIDKIIFTDNIITHTNAFAPLRNKPFHLEYVNDFIDSNNIYKEN